MRPLHSARSLRYLINVKELHLDRAVFFIPHTRTSGRMEGSTICVPAYTNDPNYDQFKGESASKDGQRRYNAYARGFRIEDGEPLKDIAMVPVGLTRALLNEVLGTLGELTYAADATSYFEDHEITEYKNGDWIYVQTHLSPNMRSYDIHSITYLNSAMLDKRFTEHRQDVKHFTEVFANIAERGNLKLNPHHHTARPLKANGIIEIEATEIDEFGEHY